MRLLIWCTGKGTTLCDIFAKKKKKKCNLNNKKIPNKPKMKDIHKITGQ